MTEQDGSQTAEHHGSRRVAGWLVYPAILIVVMVGLKLWSASSLLSADGDLLAPDVKLAALSGEIVRLSDFRGQRVLLHIWAPW